MNHAGQLGRSGVAASRLCYYMMVLADMSTAAPGTLEHDELRLLQACCEPHHRDILPEPLRQSCMLDVMDNTGTLMWGELLVRPMRLLLLCCCHRRLPDHPWPCGRPVS